MPTRLRFLYTLILGFAFSNSQAGNIVYIDSPIVKKNIIVPNKSTAAVFPSFLNESDRDKALTYVEKFCTSRKDYIFSSYKRIKKYFPKAVAILKKYNIPAAFSILLTIESDCNPNVVSHAGAVGYWQFMDEVASEYGLTYVHQLTKKDKEKIKKENPLKADSIIAAVAKQRDDRKNFTKGTHAAARYLRDRMKTFGGDLLLVAASYNCGAGNVRNAIYKSGETNANFWDIKAYLPKETQNYVMNFISLNVAFNNYSLLANSTISFKSEVKKEVENTVTPSETSVAPSKK